MLRHVRFGFDDPLGMDEPQPQGPVVSDLAGMVL